MEEKEFKKERSFWSKERKGRTGITGKVWLMHGLYRRFP